MEKTYRQLTWSIVALWYLFCLLTLNYNGPFIDEGIYITAGQRTLEGHGLTDGYLGWFAGSLLWPTMAGFGSWFGGLAGARAIAATFAAIALLASAVTTRNLFGDAAGFWATLALALNAPLVALARMGVYDAMALAGIATSLCAITELHKQDYRFWLLLAAVSFTVGMFAKYPAGLMFFPLMGVLIILRREKARTDVVFFALTSLAIALAFLMPIRERIAPFFAYRLTNSPASDVSVAMIAVDLWSLSAVPLALAAAGWLAAKNRRLLASVLFLCLFLWPAYHLVLRDSVSRNKHIVYGFVFAYPLVGLALAKLWEVRLPIRLSQAATVALVVALGAVGSTQGTRLTRAWPDARPAVSYLLGQVRPGQRLLINESWPYTMYLYRENRISSPWDVFDVYRITHDESEIGLCEYDWFVESQGANQWPASIRDEVFGCGTFEPVFSTTSDVENMGFDLNYVSYQVSITVWQNTGKVTQ